MSRKNIVQANLRAVNPGANAQDTASEETGTPDSEVVARPKKRQLTARYKLKIVAAAEACHEPGEVGALLRREGLYWSYLSKWREQKARGILSEKTPVKQGRPMVSKSPEQLELEKLRQTHERTLKRLKRAELIIELQKKSFEIMGISLSEELTENSD